MEKINGMEKVKERAVLIAVDRGNYNVKETLDELSLLCATLDLEVVERVYQRRKRMDPAYYIGRGKLQKIMDIAEIYDVDYIIADDELSPVQARNIEEFTGRKVYDRTQVILEIFARHASSEEGKIQVELAKFQYELPRLVGYGKELSRLGGGIGTRGPGEQLIQRKRSEIRRRIAYLKGKLEEIKKERSVQRKRRKEANYALVSIAGYTNAGKSSLLNLISSTSDAVVEDKLFATLEPITRRVKLPTGRMILVSDTVGFIRKLPHTIVAAFRATLEEIKESDLIVHLVDASDPYYKNKYKESLKVLEDIGAIDVPRITVFNKIDIVHSDRLRQIMEEFPEAVFISVKRRIGLESFYERLDYELSKQNVRVKIKVSQNAVGVIYSSLDRVNLIAQEFSDGVVVVEIEGKKSVIDEILGKTKGEVIG